MNVTALLAFNQRVEDAYSAACQPLLSETGLPQTSMDILLFLANHPAHCTAGEVSTVRQIKPNVVSIHVDRLVREQYLERQSVAGDRRKVKLVCTRKAGPVIRRGQQIQKEFVRMMMNGLSEEERNVFRHCFEVISANAEQMQNRNRSEEKKNV